MKPSAPKASLLILSAALLLLASGAPTARGQSALDGFDPNANGIVQVVVVQPDGKILIGGDFTIVQGISRNRIARLNADGTLDQLFDPNANGYVNTFAVQADGKILVGGSFNGANSIGGQTRNRIARLDGTTGQADSFNPNADDSVYSIAVQADGKVLAGGRFTSIGGQTRNRMARLDATTGLADSFDYAVVGFAVNVIVVQADGRILVGGTFIGIGGQPRSQIARLDAATGLADSFNPNATSGFVAVTAIAIQADGKVLAGGTFSTIGGQARNYIARLDATTGAADSFNPNANNIVRSIAVQSDGKILVGGDFNVFYSAITIGGQTRNGIARLDAVTGLADSFDPNANGGVYSIAVQADGKILAGGNFTALSPNGGAAVTRNRIARLETNGSLDQTLDVGTLPGFVYATAVQPDGKILLGGSFLGGIGRLNPDGTLDLLFNPNANSEVYSIAVQSDGKILAGGLFTTIGGQTRNRIARLDATTGLADSFDPSANALVLSIAVQADGKILAGGNFTSIGGQTRNRIARLDPISGAADSFNPNANDGVNAIEVQAAGKILVGGRFNGANSIGGQTRNRIARLDPISGAVDSFDPNANNAVIAIVVQADGKILVGGTFTTIGGQALNRIARFDPTSGAVDSFNPNATGTVFSIAVQSDGKILVGGTFIGANSIGGASRSRIWPSW